ncbi:MAG: SUMF1/EgtB/PvdO family nonheme iron enzyme [Candidatus Hydrogenedentes bacterium]|nr:SUMF1/EgtB/PvdO family nonheme iron enzyme [Candidatus Hydrogenedentota bacterium]
MGICFGCGERLQVPSISNLLQDGDLRFNRGDRISDRYVIEEQIGQGGMGVVYQATDTLMTEAVALKFMNPRLLRTQKGQRLFIQEAQIARRLRHENIVAVHDVTSTPDGILYLSMEFLKGQSLRSYLRRQRKDRKYVDIRLVVTLISQVLAALEYAHRTVVHRDIKPENVMLMPGERVKVLDFGLAKVLDEEVSDTPNGNRQGARVVGTLAYAAPEQHYHRGIDLRTDIFTVGLMFRELLTLRTPMDEPAEVVDVRSDVSPSLLAVLEKALRAEKENRWQSAGEFRHQLLHAFDESYRQYAVHHVHVDSATKVSTEGMVYLEGGSFLIGSNESPEEAPEFEAQVEPFYMDVSPVTTEQYAVFLEATDHPEPKFWRHAQFNGPHQPVVGVTWADANAYAQWAGKRLPSEIEWEYAARGKANRKYPWGNQEPDSTRSNFGDFLNMPSIVTMHEDGATPEGLFDLAGNVYEWTLDYFLPYDLVRQGNPGATTSPRRVVRGGSWHSTKDELRCTHRKGLFPEAQLTTVGFRCVLAVQPPSTV